MMGGPWKWKKTNPQKTFKNVFRKKYAKQKFLVGLIFSLIYY